MTQTPSPPGITPGLPPHAVQDMPAPLRFPRTGWRGLDRIVAMLAALAGICLLGIVIIVTLGVVMRYVFGAPLLGVNEFVQLTAVALIMASLPYCTAGNDHVAVDVFEHALGRWGRLIGDVLSRVLAGLVLSILTQRAFAKVLDAWEWGDATNMLRMPIWPFYLILAAGSGLCVIIFAVQIVALLRRGAL